MDLDDVSPAFSDPGCACGVAVCHCDMPMRALYAYAGLRTMPAMSDEQRAWCIHEILFAGTGNQDGRQLAAMDDGALASRVIAAYSALARSSSGTGTLQPIAVVANTSG